MEEKEIGAYLEARSHKREAREKVRRDWMTQNGV